MLHRISDVQLALFYALVRVAARDGATSERLEQFLSEELDTQMRGGQQVHADDPRIAALNLFREDRQARHELNRGQRYGETPHVSNLADPQTVVGQIECLLTQSQDGKRKWDRDIADKVFELLHLDRLSQRVNYADLDLLRQSILTRSEMGIIRQKIEGKIRCQRCDEPLADGEMAVIVRNNKAHIGVQCAVCAEPQNIRTACCRKSTVGVPNNIKKALQSFRQMMCVSCNPPKKKAEGQGGRVGGEAPTFQPVQAGGANPARVRAGAGNQVQPAAPPAMPNDWVYERFFQAPENPPPVRNEGDAAGPVGGDVPGIPEEARGPAPQGHPFGGAEVVRANPAPAVLNEGPLDRPVEGGGGPRDMADARRVDDEDRLRVQQVIDELRELDNPFGDAPGIAVAARIADEDRQTEEDVA